jgi:hypothetical protein
MSSAWLPPCVWCKHFHTETFIDVLLTGARTCKAFPQAIPRDIWEGYFDHRRPHPDDQDIQFEEQMNRADLVSPLDSWPDEQLAVMKRLMYQVMERQIKSGRPPKRNDREDIV